MPLAAAGVGFAVTLGLLFTLWALMCYTALLLLEVYQHVPADMGLGSLAARYLGRYGQWVTGFCMLFLLYALTAAYISGAGELLASSLNQWLDWQLPPAAGVLLFTALGGAVVCIGTSLVDLFNRFLFSAKIIFLVIMLALLAKNAGLNGLLEAIREVVASPHVELAVHLFADLALATSFLGVSLGLFDYLADVFQRKNSVSGRLQSGAITFLPPVAFALFYPRGFVMALGYAGVALAVLALMLPALLAMKSRRQHPQAAWRVVGGAPALWLVLLCGIGIVAIQFSIVAGLLPAVG